MRRTESFSRVMRTERNATGRIEALPPSALREGAFRVFGLPERKASPECSKRHAGGTEGARLAMMEGLGRCNGVERGSCPLDAERRKKRPRRAA